VRSTNHEASTYVIFSSLLLLPTSWAQTVFSAPHSQTPPAHILPLMTHYCSHPHKTSGKTAVLYISNFIILGSKWEDRRFLTEQ